MADIFEKEESRPRRRRKPVPAPVEVDEQGHTSAHQLLLAHEKEKRERIKRWLLNPRRLALYGCIMASTAYFGGAYAIVRYLDRDPTNRIDWFDLVLPTHWKGLAEKRGRALVDRGMRDLRDGDYVSAIVRLNRGLALAPDEVRARMVVVTHYVRLGYVHRALQILRDGLSFGKPSVSYRDALLRVCNYLEDYNASLEIISMLQGMLPSDEISTQRWLVGQKALALEKLGRYDEVTGLRAQNKDAPIFAVEGAWARSLAARGRAADALEEVEQDPERFGVKADRLMLLVNLNLLAGRSEKALAVLEQWRRDEPLNSSPLLEQIVTLVGLKRDQEARVALRDFYSNFIGDIPAQEALLRRLGELTDPVWLQAAWRETQAVGTAQPGLQALYVQGLLMMGKISEAQREYDILRDMINSRHIADGGWAEATRLLLQALQNFSPSSREQLLDYCTKARLTPTGYQFVVRTLRAGEIHSLANEAVVMAQNRFPSFIDRSKSALSGHQAVSIWGQIPDREKDDGGMKAKMQDASAKFDLLTRGESLDDDTLAKRIENSGRAQYEQAQVAGAVRTYLRRGKVDADFLRRLATEWDNDAQRESALTLLREINEAQPNETWAKELRKKIEGDLQVAPVEIPTTSVPAVGEKP